MTVPAKLRLKNTIKYPTSIIVGGLNKLGLEIADSLVKQGGYVIIIDSVTDEGIEKLDHFENDAMISFLDFTAIPHLEEDIRRLDYVFYFSHESLDFRSEVSTQEFLTFSNYLDAALSLTAQFDARFLLTTSIKSNQILFATDPAYKVSKSNSFTQTYTDMEVQRYAEGLVLEYHEKVNLNARIIRLGEIIGDGIDFAAQSAFVRLITNAAQGEPLLLQNDGLENEWLVHILDAAYAIIKAQFSKETNGKIYSVCYDNTYTHLSIAYKIQEVDDEVNEIQFMEEDDGAPPIRIYRPAPNLSEIGWMPKVSFDKAVKQSLAAAKINALEQSVGEMPDPKHSTKKKTSFTDKVKSFLSLADESELVIENNDPVNKLIQERKAQNNLKKQKLSSARTTIKIKKKYRKLSFTEKLVNGFWDFFVRLSNTFKFLRRLSPIQLGLLTIFTLIFLFLYLTIISPFLVLFKNGITISQETNRLETAIVDNNFVTAYQSSNRITNALSESKDIIVGFDRLSSFLKLDPIQKDLEKLIYNYELLGTGIKNISYAIEPFTQYTNEIENNTFVRTSSDSYISLLNNGVDYSSYLAELESRKAFLESGIQKYQEAITEIQTTEYSSLPNFIQAKVSQLNSLMADITESIKYTKVYEYLPELLGNKAPKTYLVFGLDNTRITPIGGEIASIAVLTVNNGSLQKAQITSPESFGDLTFSDSDIKELNLTRFLPIGDSITIRNLGSISNFEDFSKITEVAFENKLQQNIDGVITVDLLGLEGFLTDIDTGENITISGISFSSGDILTNLNNINTGGSLLSKQENIAQVSAYALNNFIKGLNNQPSETLKLLSDLFNSKSIKFYTDELDIQEYLYNLSYDTTKAFNADTYLNFFIDTIDPKFFDSQKIPSVNLALNMNVTENYEIENTLNVVFPDIGIAQEVGLCLPFNAIIASISSNPNLVPEERTTLNFGERENCVVAQVISENEIQFTWRTESLLNTNSLNKSITVGIPKVGGAIMSLDVTITTADGVTLSSLNVPVQINDGATSFVEPQLEKDLILELGFQ